MKTEITTEQLEALRREAAAAGDTKQVELCDAALLGDESARAKCSKAIDNARAQD